MSSVVAPMPKSRCRSCCSKKFVSRIHDAKLKIAVYVCELCGDHPKDIKLRRMLPIGTDGESIRVDILRNRLEERITSVDEAIHIARSIDYDLRDGRFDANNYRPGNSEAFFFKTLILNKYIPFCENKFGVGGFETKQVMINHLLNYFSLKDVRKIKTVTIKEYQFIYKCGARSKDLSIQELGVALNFFKDIGILTTVPEMPDTKQSRERNIKEFLTKAEQEKVISRIKDIYYRDMIEVLAIYALRPGDLRAIKWKDLNFANGTISINEHFAKSTLKSGRKSTNEELVLPMTDRFLEIISKLPRSVNGDDFVFKAKTSKGNFTSGPVGEARMRIHWNAANLIAERKDKIKVVSLYIGTKSTSLTSYTNDGNRHEDLLCLTGHASVKTLKRYAKESDENKLIKVKNILNKASKLSSGFL